MKVFELMSELAKCAAGASVYLQRGELTFHVALDRVSIEGEMEVFLVGDDTEPQEGDIEA